MTTDWVCPKHPGQPTEAVGADFVCSAYRCGHASRGRVILGTRHIAAHPWPAATFLQGGDRGVVATRKTDQPVYYTAFVEAVDQTEGATSGFLRGEGPTVADAENAAWDKFVQRTACPNHDWDARGYRNGAGICRLCNAFGSKVFTPEDLGFICIVCSTPTYYSWIDWPGLPHDTAFTCAAHTPVSYGTVDDHLQGEEASPGEDGVGSGPEQIITLLGDVATQWATLPFQTRWAAVADAQKALLRQQVPGLPADPAPTPADT